MAYPGGYAPDGAAAGGGGGAWAGYGYGSLNPPTSAQKSKYLQDFASADDQKPRTMFVEGLNPAVTEELIFTLFGQIGAVTKCKLIMEPGTEPFAFVEFADHDTAAQALIAMNKRLLLEHEMKVSWASTPSTTAKVDTTNHFHVFIGDLSPEVDNKALKEAFQIYGEMSDCKVIRDPQTLMSKGYGFVTFVQKEDAEKAIEGMNGQWLGRRAIRTNWATRKPGGASKSYDEVYNSTTGTNTTVYVGGISSSVTDEDLRKSFGKYGEISEIRLFKAQGYAFCRYNNKESAAQAITNLNGTDVAGCSVRCSWGRQQEQKEVTQPQSAGGAYGYAYGYGPGPQGGGGGGGAPGYGQQQQQQAWNQYWQQYYSNPAVMQQWQSYYQQQQQQGGH